MTVVTEPILMSETTASGRGAETETRHGCTSNSEHDRKLPEIDLLSPLKIRGEEFRNRVVMSPMCQYCATEGLADDWHLVHLGSRAVGGVGLDLIDVSSGALVPKARIPVAKGYQVPFARKIRCEADIMTGAVGMITDAGYANEIITEGDADLVFVGRELLRQPYWALGAEHELGAEPSWPTSYGYAVRRRAK
jgi:2,4-dienoyl-CoA reductase-like NADH-dependent reductase (Old Yellow Enzyme family)